MSTHQGMYNVAREDGRREVMAGLQQQQQQNDAVGQMVAGARSEAGQEGFAAGEQSGADKAMNAILASQQQAGLPVPGQPVQQEAAAYPPEMINSAIEQLTSQPVGEAELQQINASNPGLLEQIDTIQPGLIASLLGQQQAPQGATQAGLSVAPVQ